MTSIAARLERASGRAVSCATEPASSTPCHQHQSRKLEAQHDHAAVVRAAASGPLVPRGNTLLRPPVADKSRREQDAQPNTPCHTSPRHTPGAAQDRELDANTIALLQRRLARLAIGYTSRCG